MSWELFWWLVLKTSDSWDINRHQHSSTGICFYALSCIELLRVKEEKRAIMLIRVLNSQTMTHSYDSCKHFPTLTFWFFYLQFIPIYWGLDFCNVVLQRQVIRGSKKLYYLSFSYTIVEFTHYQDNAKKTMFMHKTDFVLPLTKR